MEQLTYFLKNSLNLPQQLAIRVIEFYEVDNLKKGEYLIKKGQYCRKMVVIEQGYLRFFSYAQEKMITHWIFGKNQLVTDVSSFFLEKPAKWNIQAISDTTFFSISHHNYQKLRVDVPEWNEYETMFLIKLMSALENRIYTLISMSTEERYRYLFEENSNLFNELPLQHIASMIGMTPETLSRIRKKISS